MTAITREELEASNGASIIGFIQSGTSSAARTVEAKLRERMSTADKSGTFLQQLDAVAADLDLGGCCLIPRGAHTLGDTFVFNGYGLILEGDGGPSGTSISFDPDDPKAAFIFDRNAKPPAHDGDNGGVAYAEVRNLSFTSSNDTDKTAIKLVNDADCRIRNIAIITDGWQGDSIGIHSKGRQLLVIEECVLACARPILCGTNATYPTLAVDHFYIDNNNLVGTSSSRPILEFENGVSFANTKVWNSSFAGGKDGILWNDSSSTAAGFNLEIINCRFEQGLDAAAYAINLQSTEQNLQNLLLKDCQFGNDRNGVKLRQCQRVTMINCQFNQSEKTALDITMIAGSRLEMINCSGAGAFTITNGRCVSKSSDNRSLGFTETWVYDANDSSGHVQMDTPLGGVPFTLGSGTITNVTQANPAVVTTAAAHGYAVGDTASIAGVVGMTALNGNSYTVGSVPSSTTFTLAGTDSSGFGAYASGGRTGGVRVLTDDSFAGFVAITTTLDVSGIYELRGGTHQVAEAVDTAGYFTATKDGATSLNVYWQDGYKLQNNTLYTVTFSALRLGSNIGG